MDLDGQPVAGVLIGYMTADEIAAAAGRFARMIPPNGRRQTSEAEKQRVAGTSIRREGYAAFTPIITSADTQRLGPVTPEDMQVLGLVSSDGMIVQLPSNVGAFHLDGNDGGQGDWILHPSGIAFVDGKPVGETDNAGAFRVELPGGGTYVITARIDSQDGRGYGSRQPVVVEPGQMLQLSGPITLSAVRGPTPGE